MLDGFERREKVPLTKSLLNLYYDRVYTLFDYLLELLDVSSIVDPGLELKDHLYKPSDGEMYEELLRSSFVCPESTLFGERSKFVIIEPFMTMSEVIDRAQTKLLKKGKEKSSILTLGYRSSEWRGESSKNGGVRAGISNYFVNTVVVALQSPLWELLLARIGENAMFHLLTENSIFISLPNDCLCQMTGPPLIHVKPPLVMPDVETNFSFVKKRKTETIDINNRPKKRPKQDTIMLVDLGRSASSTTIERRTAGDIPFVRARLFYARPIIFPKSRHITIGLPPRHVLNRLLKAQGPKLKETNSQTERREQEERARHLSKYIFPRQYKLENVFVIVHTATYWGSSVAQLIKDFQDREAEIKNKGPTKTPKRLKHVLELLRLMIHKHSKCGYKPLLDKVCPSKLKAHNDKPVDSSIILEYVSEHSIELKTQPDVSITTDRSSISAHGPSLAAAHTKYKPKFAEFTCSYSQVYRYAVLITKLVIPKDIWGCHKNYKLVLKFVKQYITQRRYENMNLHAVLQGFSTNDCDWTLPAKIPRVYQPATVAESAKRRELLEEFLYWYFESFLLPLLKTTFYVTDSGAFRNKVLYFRQDDWEALCQPLIDRLAATTFRQIEQHEAEVYLQNRKLGFSFVRLLPKETGVRPIVNLRHKKQTNPNDPYDRSQSINQILQTAFQILTYEKEMQPKSMGSSIFGPNETYANLRGYKKQLMEKYGQMPKLWFVKVDVQACFDTIEQNKLLELLKQMISEDVYLVQKYGQITSSIGKIRRTYARKAFPDYDHPHFLTSAAHLANILRGTIFVDQVVYPHAHKDDIIQLLEDHITANIVKIGKNYYRQMVGIPQGSVLSSLLCSFFYGDLENTVLKPLIQHPDSLLLRLIDDYLFVTTDISLAHQFLKVMEKGHPEYGCFISRDKTLTNFDYEPHRMTDSLLIDNKFPWCGYHIDMNDLSISTDYTRFHETYVPDSLTIDRGRHTAAAFMYKMMRLTNFHSHIIYNDTAHNSHQVVYMNIYQNFILLAMKMHHYIKGLEATGWKMTDDPNLSKKKGRRGTTVENKEKKFLKDAVHRTIHYSYAAIKSFSRNRITRKLGGQCDIDKACMIWLGLHAFHNTLSQKPTKYSSLLKTLEFELALPRYRRWSTVHGTTIPATALHSSNEAQNEGSLRCAKTTGRPVHVRILMRKIVKEGKKGMNCINF